MLLLITHKTLNANKLLKYVQDLYAENYKTLREITDNLKKWKDILCLRTENFNNVKMLCSCIKVLTPCTSECDCIQQESI